MNEPQRTGVKSPVPLPLYRMSPDRSKQNIRSTLGRFATGVTIISAHHEGFDYGLTVNSFSSVSLTPPMILWSLQNSSANYQAMSSCGHFAVNILSSSQRDLSLSFSRPVDDRFDGVKFYRHEKNTPVLEGNLATLLCRIADTIVHGDHTIIIGEIMYSDINPDDKTEPLIFYSGSFAGLA